MVRKGIKNLDGSKATLNHDVPIKILKSTVHIHLPYKTNIIRLFP